MKSTLLTRALLWRRWLLAIAILTTFLSIYALPDGQVFAQSQTTHSTRSGSVAATTRKQTTAPIPFMHRPYYGSRTIASRTVSFVDHDHPWYDNDGIFVRYDGAKWTNVSIGSCTGGVNCYDGHNGYDLNLWYEPVLSAAAGTVIRAGWYDPLNHNNSLGLWVAIDHGNGYATAYGHLSAITVAVGDQVGVQWQIGTSGTTGSSTGPHLHMATYYLPYWEATDPFGWSGNYPDPNVVPDNYLWVSDPGTNNTVPTLSSNGSAVYPGATLVDDGGTGWSSTGSWSTASGSTDIGGALHWAWTTTGAATATATWEPTLHANGYYEVGVFVNDNNASSSWASYTVYSDDPGHDGATMSHNVYVDESHIGVFQGPFSQENTGPQWVGLGTYYFKASMSGRVVLNNATGESNQQISADGVEFVPVSVQAVPPPPVYGFSVTADSSPSVMLPGSTMKSALTIKNTSNFSWLASSANGVNATQLLYRWVDGQGHTIMTSNPIALTQNINVGNALSMTVNVQAPSLQGAFTLQWDMVQGTAVFSQHGATVKADSVQVVPRNSVVFPPTWRPLGVKSGR